MKRDKEGAKSLGHYADVIYGWSLARRDGAAVVGAEVDAALVRAGFVRRRCPDGNQEGEEDANAAHGDTFFPGRNSHMISVEDGMRWSINGKAIR